MGRMELDLENAPEYILLILQEQLTAFPVAFTPASMPPRPA